MRIISKFHDYYDSALSYGADDTLVYLRHTEEISAKNVEDKRIVAALDELGRLKIRTPSNIKKGKHYVNIGINVKALYLCGKRYPIFEVGHSISNYPINMYRDEIDRFSKTEHFSNISDVIKRCTDLTGIDFSTYKGDSEYLWDYRNGRMHRTRIKNSILDTVVTAFNNDKCIDENELLQQYNVPAILMDRATNSIILNPCLNDLGFQKTVDPWTLFQEMSMYVGGVLKRQDAMLCEISDKDRIAQHGFDKWSFRKMPGPG